MSPLSVPRTGRVDADPFQRSRLARTVQLTFDKGAVFDIFAGRPYDSISVLKKATFFCARTQNLSRVIRTKDCSGSSNWLRRENHFKLRESAAIHPIGIACRLM